MAISIFEKINQNQRIAGFGYFKTLKKLMVFIKESMVL